MAERSNPDTWTGPTAKEMIASHTLAKEIIERHSDPCPVFDDSEILKLRRFVRDPASAKELLDEFEMRDVRDEQLGTAAQAKGSLAGYIIATYGSDKSALTDDEVDRLKEWFANGGGKTAAEN